MTFLKKWVAIILIGSAATSAFALETTNTPEGYWKTMDDTTGRPKSIIQIWKTENTLVGRVIKIFPKNGRDQNKLCTACQGENHNKPIVGMVILSGLQATQNMWDNGSILDPENGKTYSCSMRVSNDGNHLNVKGYIGIPLLGRSQTWERVELTPETEHSS